MGSIHSSLLKKASPLASPMQWRGRRVPSTIPQVIHIDFPTAFDVGSVWIRPQEFYESEFEDIRGQTFSLETFMDRYAKAKGGFTYFEDWGGFNLPDFTLREFFEKFKAQLSQKEAWLQKELSSELKKDEKFYVIATFQAKPDIVAHEEAHALFYLNKTYQADQCENVYHLKEEVRQTAHQWLLDTGYHKTVIEDEIQAYAATSTFRWLKETWGMTRTQARSFRLIFQRYKTHTPRRKRRRA